MWQNLNWRNMRGDNYCPRSGEPEESVIHAIFECAPTIQVWSLSRHHQALILSITEHLYKHELSFLEKEHYYGTWIR